MDILERAIHIVSVTGGIGLGLWMSSNFGESAIVGGVLVLFISAIVLIILIYLRNKKLKK